MSHLKGDSPELRARPSKAVATANPTVVGGPGKFADVDPVAILKAGVRTVRHHKLGWLREDLLANESIDGTIEALYTRLFSDFQAQQIHIRAQKYILGDDFNPLHVMSGRDKEGRFSFTKNVDVPKKWVVGNGRRSYGSLEKAINNWCCKNTIMRFLKSFEDYITYSQNVRPLLSEGNRMKQVSFSTHVRNRWGLGPTKKILWTMR